MSELTNFELMGFDLLTKCKTEVTQNFLTQNYKISLFFRKKNFAKNIIFYDEIKVLQFII